MRSPSTDLAVTKDLLVGVGPFVVGVVIVIALGFLALHYGRRRREKEPVPPQTPQPRGAAWRTREQYGEPTSVEQRSPEVESGYEDVSRPAEEVPRDGRRRRPQEFRDYPGPRT